MLVDLSHPLDADIPMFPGFPAPEIASFISREESRAFYSPGTEFLIQRYTMIGNSGTYLDAPYHRYADGADLAALELGRLCDIPGVVVDVRSSVRSGMLEIGIEAVPEHVSGCAVLFQTGWDVHWLTPQYLAANPFLNNEAAAALVQCGAVLVGIDSWNVDDVADMARPAHSLLLRAEIPVVENLCNLDRLNGRAFRFHAPVLPLRHGAAIPVRAYAVLEPDM